MAIKKTSKKEAFKTPAHLAALENLGGWLIKSEPFKYSWQQFIHDKYTHWDGVRNYAARNFLKEMKVGDQLFFYHSNEQLAIVGIAMVVKTYYQDPTTTDTNWVVVDVAPVRELIKPIPLSVMKATPALVNMKLLTIGRLSVSPVTTSEWKAILQLEKKDN